MTLPNAANALFKIDDAQVEGLERQDTRHALVPQGLTSNRVEYITGSRTPFVLKGRQRLPLLIVAGVLRTANFNALQTLIRTHEAWVDSTTTCKVTIHTTVYNPIAPIGFKTVDQFPQAFADLDQPVETPGAKQRVLFTFQVLTL